MAPYVRRVTRWNPKTQQVEEYDPQAARRCGPKQTGNPWTLGLESDALSVHPDQVPEFREFAKREGLTGIRNLDDGRCIVHSRKHRKALCEHLGFYDRNGGYGDAMPRNV